MAAHSIGGFEANAYAASYPDEVAGVILIDSLSPGAWLELHTPHTQGLVSRLFPLIRPTGVLRFIGTFFPDYIEKSSQGRANNYLFVDPSLKEMDKIHIMHNYMNRMTLKEGELSRTNAQTVQNLGFPSNVHLESIIAFAPKDIPNYTQILQLQNAWVSQSAKGELHKLEGEHSIYHYYPDEVCEIIEKVFNDLKK